jgi:hypothetical protein
MKRYDLLEIQQQLQRWRHTLGERVDQEVEADRLFFLRHSYRQHYIRRVFPFERLEYQLMIGESVEPPLGMALYMAVKQIHATKRMKVGFFAAADFDTNLSEETCAITFRNEVNRGRLSQ